MKDPRDKFELSDIYNPLENSNGLIFKHMFGGMAVYSEGLMKFLHCEDRGEGTNEWRGQVFDFAIWHGMMICTDYAHHESLLKDYPELVNHPILAKWLYLPLLEEDDFRSSAKKLLHKALKNDLRIGIVPGKKKSKTKKKTTKKKKKKKKKKGAAKR